MALKGHHKCYVLSHASFDTRKPDFVAFKQKKKVQT